MDFVRNDQLEIHDKSNEYVVGVVKERNSLLFKDQLCGKFDGVSSMLNYVNDHMPEPRQERSSSMTSQSGMGMMMGSFHTFDTYEQAMQTYRLHPSKVKSFDEIDLALTDLDSAGQASEFDVTGDYIDIGRYLEGDPECFGVMIDGNPRARRVNLVINLGWSGSVSERIINARSRRIQRLIDWLEARGVRVGIQGISANQCSYMEVAVKHHDEQLDLNDLAVVTHADFHRRITFRFREYSQTWEHGYGNSRHFNQYVWNTKFENEHQSEYDIFIGNAVANEEQITKEFDDAELKLNRTLGKDVLETSQRVIRLFGSEATMMGSNMVLDPGTIVQSANGSNYTLTSSGQWRRA